MSIEIPKESIGPAIGPGACDPGDPGRDADHDVLDEVDGAGHVQIMSENKAGIDAALARIKAIAFPPTAEIGVTYKGKVKTIMPYGAFVEIFPGTDGLLHVSELDWKRIENVADVLKEGEIIEFQVVGKDPRTGKLKLSRKVLLPKPEGYVEREPAMEGDRSERPRREYRDRGPRREHRSQLIRTPNKAVSKESALVAFVTFLLT